MTKRVDDVKEVLLIKSSAHRAERIPRTEPSLISPDSGPHSPASIVTGDRAAFLTTGSCGSTPCLANSKVGNSTITKNLIELDGLTYLKACFEVVVEVYFRLEGVLKF